MNMNSDISYHLHELKIAGNPESPHYVMPEFSPKDQVILDIGCGIGQTFVGSQFELDNLLIGLDVNLKCLNYGHRRWDYIKFVNGKAESLPFHDASFDFVISRVSLPYTNIPKSLTEISRVLKDNGRIWITLHSFSATIKDLKQSTQKFAIKRVIHQCFVLANGIFFHFFGKLLYLPVIRRYESFQTKSRIEECMKKNNFIEICVKNDNHFVCKARKEKTINHSN